MALKFLNKKGWHTGSLRNIENVWKAEQKHDGEQKKLEELRKQIHEERERSEFRLLQEQAGLVPKQERLDFLYESGLAVGKSSDGFKALAAPATAPAPPPAEPSSSKVVPGALFEDKPQSANDTWRKLHSDPLLLIRQREKEALDRIKNNPMKMAMIKKSVEAEKKQKGDKEDKREKKERKRKHKSKHAKHSSRATPDSEDKSEDDHERRKSKRSSHEQGHRGSSKHEKHPSDEKRKHELSKSEHHEEGTRNNRESGSHSQPSEEKRKHELSKSEHHEEGRRNNRASGSHHSDEKRKHELSKSEHHEEGRRNNRPNGSHLQEDRGYGYNRQRGPPKISEEERAARLREMQLDAELHEEQRWKRLKKAADADAKEAAIAATSSSRGKNFLDAAQESIYGAEGGGNFTIEESVRKRKFWSQGGVAAHETNAFRR